MAAVRLGVAATALLGVKSASAQAALDQPLQEGFALNPFDPAPAGDRFFIVDDGWTRRVDAEDTFPVSAMALGHLTLGPSLTRKAALTANERDILTQQLYLHASGTVYAMDSWLLNVDVPFAVIQEGDGPLAPSSALGDVRFGLRLGLLQQQGEPFELGVPLDLYVPTGDEEQLTGDAEWRFHPQLAASGKAGGLVYAANGGFILRKSMIDSPIGVAPPIEIGPSVTFGLGAGWSLMDGALQLGGEVSGRVLVSSEQGQEFASATSPVSSLLSLRARGGDFVFGAGAGPALTGAPGVATRIALSVAYVPCLGDGENPSNVQVAEADSDGDGVSDADDRCPVKPGRPQPGTIRHGCPAGVGAAHTIGASDTATLDSDGDGVPDADDACPEKLGDSSEDPKLHGCPISDFDKDGIADGDDACPREAGLASAGATNGCPADTDRDGIDDQRDACPQQPGIATGAGATHGCPGTTAADVPVTPGPALATFLGYRHFDERHSQLFVELTKGAEVETVKDAATRYRIVLKDTEVTYRNNRRPLRTGEFNSALGSARLRAEGKDVEIVIRLRAPAEVGTRTVQRPGGVTVQIDLRR